MSTDVARMISLTKRQAGLILAMIEYCENDWYLIARETWDDNQRKNLFIDLADIGQIAGLLDWADEEEE